MKITKLFPSTQLEKAKEALEAAKRIAIFTHQRPDGDALGSALCMWHLLRKLGKDAVVICPDPYPSDFSFLPGSEEVLIYQGQEEEVADAVRAADFLLMVDFNHRGRLGDMSHLLMEGNQRHMLIDHHPHPESDCDLCFCYPSMSSTCELMFRFVDALGYLALITEKEASCLYLGMMTDTHSLAHNSSHPEVYFIVGELLGKGVDKQKIQDILYNSFRASTLRLRSYAIGEKMELWPEYNTAIIHLSEEELEAFDYEPGDTEGLVNIPLSIKDVHFSVFFRPSVGKLRVSLRSKGDFPANKFAEELFGGGGHLNAAGGDSAFSYEDALKRLRLALEKYKASSKL